MHRVLRIKTNSRVAYGQRISPSVPCNSTLKCRMPLCFTAFCRVSCKTRNRQSEISFGTLRGMSVWLKSISTFCCSDNSLQKLLAAATMPRYSSLKNGVGATGPECPRRCPEGAGGVIDVIVKFNCRGRELLVPSIQLDCQQCNLD